MSNAIAYDATEHNVYSVTVFQVNTAEVTRRIELDLKKGQNEVTIRNLPSVLDEDSIRVDGIGKAVVFDVIYKAPILHDHLHAHGHGNKRKAESPQIEALLKQKITVKLERDVVENQRNILNSYSKTISNEFNNAATLSQFLNTFGKSQLEFSTKLQDLDDRLNQLDKEIRVAREALGKHVGNIKLGTRIVVIVLADEDGPAELSLTYNVSGAYWKPIYDVRANIASSNKPDSKSSITLDYRAAITQHSAEDWKDVHLTLSTASPQLGSVIPTLTPIKLGEMVSYGSEMKKKKKKGSSVSRSGSILPDADARMRRKESVVRSQAHFLEEEDSDGSASVPTALAHAGARVSSHGEGFSSAFVVDGLTSIPSDTDDSSESHKVTISIVHLENVDLEWVTVPKEGQSVFLKAKVKNTSEFTFLAGAASIFMNNNFVAKSSIPLVSPAEFFSISLGADPSVRITYHPQSKKVNIPTGGFITASRVSTNHQQTITVKNTRSIPLSKLIVKDQVPISTHAQIKVEVREPSLPELNPETGTKSKGSKNLIGAAAKDVSVNGLKDVRARWCRANADDEDGGVNASAGEVDVNTEGLMEWICRVEPSSSFDLKLCWEVNAPKGFKWKQY